MSGIIKAYSCFSNCSRRVPTICIARQQEETTQKETWKVSFSPMRLGNAKLTGSRALAKIRGSGEGSSSHLRRVPACPAWVEMIKLRGDHRLAMEKVDALSDLHGSRVSIRLATTLHVRIPISLLLVETTSEWPKSFDTAVVKLQALTYTFDRS